MEEPTSPLSARMLPRCPTCRREVHWPDNPNRPFCSLTCRLLDLGVWLDEGYRIPAAEVAKPEEPAPEQD